MESLYKIRDELSTEYVPGSSHWVCVTHIINPHNFYVRPCTYDSQLEYLESSRLTNKERTDARIFRVIAFRSDMNGGKIIRGQIMSITETELSKTCEVFAMDYGFVAKEVPAEDIFKCNKDFIPIPATVLCCELHLCAPIGGVWSAEAIECFKFYLAEGKAKLTIMQRISNKFTVELVNSYHDISIQMALTECSTMGYMPPTVSSFASSSKSTSGFNFRERELNDTLHVRMLYGKRLDEFYVAELAEYEDYLKLIDDINFHASVEKTVNVNKMVNGFPALVYEEHPKCSHRAEIISFSLLTHEGTVHLIDSGQRVVAKECNIRNIPQKLMTHPATAIYCSAQALPIEVLPEDFFLEGFEFYITIQKVGIDLTMPNIVKVTLK